jgi:general secretion pathway protein F
MKQDLPGSTKFLIFVSDFLISYGSYLLSIIIIILVSFFISMKKSDGFRFSVHKKIINAPLIGRILLFSQIAKWSRSFGMLLSSGVPMLQALSISVQTITNNYLHKAVSDISKSVREGRSLHSSMQKSDVFPSFVIHMTSSGEASGNLEKMLMKISDYYTQLVKTTMDTSLKLFEPLLIVVMGGVVMFIVLSILLPIFKINTMV